MPRPASDSMELPMTLTRADLLTTTPAVAWAMRLPSTGADPPTRMAAAPSTSTPGPPRPDGAVAEMPAPSHMASTRERVARAPEKTTPGPGPVNASPPNRSPPDVTVKTGAPEGSRDASTWTAGNSVERAGPTAWLATYPGAVSPARFTPSSVTSGSGAASVITDPVPMANAMVSDPGWPLATHMASRSETTPSGPGSAGTVAAAHEGAASRTSVAVVTVMTEGASSARAER